MSSLFISFLDLAKTGIGDWPQLSWRPNLMISVKAILVNNHLIFLYLSIFGIATTFIEFFGTLRTLLYNRVGTLLAGLLTRASENGKRADG